MKYCSNCGKELDDKAVVCPACGVQVAPFTQSEPKPYETLAGITIVGFVLSFIFPIVGLIVSIIAHGNAKITMDQRNLSFSRAGIIISSVIIGISVLTIIITIASCIAILGTAEYYYY